MGPAEWSALVFLSVLWGGSFFFVEVALTNFTPLLIVALRAFIAALAIWIFVLAKELRSDEVRKWPEPDRDGRRPRSRCELGPG